MTTTEFTQGRQESAGEKLLPSSRSRPPACRQLLPRGGIVLGRPPPRVGRPHAPRHRADARRRPFGDGVPVSEDPSHRLDNLAGEQRAAIRAQALERAVPEFR